MPKLPTDPDLDSSGDHVPVESNAKALVVHFEYERVPPRNVRAFVESRGGQAKTRIELEQVDLRRWASKPSISTVFGRSPEILFDTDSDPKLVRQSIVGVNANAGVQYFQRHHDLPSYLFHQSRNLVRTKDTQRKDLKKRGALFLALELAAIGATHQSSLIEEDAERALAEYFDGIEPLQNDDYLYLFRGLHEVLAELVKSRWNPYPLWSDEDKFRRGLRLFEQLTAFRFGADSIRHVPKLTDHQQRLLIADHVYFAGGRLAVPGGLQGFFNCAPNGPFYFLLPTLSLAAVDYYRSTGEKDGSKQRKLRLWEAWSRATVAGVDAFAPTYENREIGRRAGRYRRALRRSSVAEDVWSRSRASRLVEFAASWRMSRDDGSNDVFDRFSKQVRYHFMDAAALEFPFRLGGRSD